jgi:hypothetical protein
MRDSWKAIHYALATIASHRQGISIKLAGNCITHQLGVQIGGEKVSIELETNKMELVPTS